MAKSGVTWRVVEDKFGEIVQGMEATADLIVRKTAMDLQAGAQVRAPVDTGYLKNSIQAVRVGPAHWRVTVQADYGIYLEYGTVNMAARPYFQPAIDQVRPAFLAAMKLVIK